MSRIHLVNCSNTADHCLPLLERADLSSSPGRDVAESARFDFHLILQDYLEQFCCHSDAVHQEPNVWILSSGKNKNNDYHFIVYLLSIQHFIIVTFLVRLWVVYQIISWLLLLLVHLTAVQAGHQCVQPIETQHTHTCVFMLC